MTISGLHPTQLKARLPICKNQPALAQSNSACLRQVACSLSFSGLFALTLSLSLSQSALATKLNAPPLPHASAAGSTGVSGDVNEYGRPIKDFSHGKEDTMPNTQWKDRHDYREREKQEKEEAAAKAKAAVDAAKKAREDRINAIKTYQQISIDANNKAIALGKQGKLTEAIAEHELSLKYDPGNKQFKINLSAAQTLYGQKLLAQKDYAGSSNMFRKALVAAPDNGQAGKYLSESIQRMGLDPSLADNRVGIGDQLMAAGDVQGALIEYNTAMRLDPSARTYTKLGDVYQRYHNLGQALQYYRQAIIKDADYGPAHRQMGNIYMAAKDLTGAASELRKAVIIDPKDTAAGQGLIDIWRRQVAQNPTLAENHLGLGSAMQLTGDIGTAENEYNMVEKLDPRNASLPAARASLQRAVKHIAAERHKAAAEAFLNQGLGRDALAEMGQAVMTEPHNDKYQFLMGQCLESNGDMEGAKQSFHNAVVINPKNEEAAKHLREVENNLAQGGQGGGRPPSRPSPPPSLTRPEQAGSQAAQQNAGMGIGSTQAGAPGSGQSGMASGRDKNMFEGSPQTANARMPNQGSYPGPGQGAAPQYNSQYNSQGAPNSSQQRPPAANSPGRAPTPALTLDPQTQATLVAADNMERQHDFQGAANLLQQSLSTNLQNPEIHHRLASDLLNLGQLEEAVSEYRIASALSPGNKIFGEDYARALKIHKKAMMLDNAESGGGSAQTTGAVGDLK